MCTRVDRRRSWLLTTARNFTNNCYSLTNGTALNTSYNEIRKISVCSYSPEKQACRVRGRGGLRSESEARVASRFVLQAVDCPPPTPLCSTPRTRYSTLLLPPSRYRVSVSFCFVCPCVLF